MIVRTVIDLHQTQHTTEKGTTEQRETESWYMLKRTGMLAIRRVLLS